MKRFLFTLFFGCFFLGFSQQTLEPFLSDLVKQFPNVRDVAISPEGSTICFSAQSVMGNTSAIITVSKHDNVWDTPKVASFSGQYFDIEPFFSSDGLSLYFASNRPLDSNNIETKDFDIWYVKRSSTHDKWSQPINIGTPINTKYDEFYPSLSLNNNLYFTCDNPTLNRKDDIYISEFENGKYTTPKALSDVINSDGYEFNAFIAPDESFLIYTCYGRKDGFGSGDLYISYHNKEGWTEAKNLGNTVNTNKMDYCPYVDTKTNTLYFTSKLDNSKTIFNRPQTLEELKNEFYKYDNGSSRLYKINIEELLKK